MIGAWNMHSGGHLLASRDLVTVTLDKMKPSGWTKRFILSKVHYIERSHNNECHICIIKLGPGKSIILANIILSRDHYIESHCVLRSLLIKVRSSGVQI